MDNEKLFEILKKHKMWLNDEDGGECADLCRADLREAYLRGADLRGANLSRADLSRADLSRADLYGANLSGANLDYSCWPLWCGSLVANVDDRIAIQLLYHTLSVVQHSPYVSDELKHTLLIQPIVDAANQFHRVGECGKLSAYTESDGDRV